MPALGKDLSKIRSHLGLSIQDVQHYTKIPVATLKSIEDGTIFAHPEENQTYIRSFVRSYGRALKIDDDVMIKALDQNESGNYNHILLEDYPGLQPAQTAQEEKLETQPKAEPDLEDEQSEVPERQLFDEQEAEDDNDETEIQHIEIGDESSGDESEKEPEIAKTVSPGEDTKPQTSNTERSVKSVNWADVGRKFNQEKKQTPVWIIGLIIILIIAVFVGYFLYQNGFLSIQGLMPEQQEEVAPENETAQSSLSLDLEDSLAASEAGNQTVYETPSPVETTTELGEVIELTVYAAYDALGPVRVWSDLKPRMDPYWLEQGTAMEFEFEDTIRVRGSYSDFLLFKDGHLVENAAQEFLQQEEDYIQLTRDFFTSDSKWATSIDYELPEGVQPPDSIANRPTF
jgi:cytoskeletal protein RodZ